MSAEVTEIPKQTAQTFQRYLGILSPLALSLDKKRIIKGQRLSVGNWATQIDREIGTNVIPIEEACLLANLGARAGYVKLGWGTRKRENYYNLRFIPDPNTALTLAAAFLVKASENSVVTKKDQVLSTDEVFCLIHKVAPQISRNDTEPVKIKVDPSKLLVPQTLAERIRIVSKAIEGKQTSTNGLVNGNATDAGIADFLGRLRMDIENLGLERSASEFNHRIFGLTPLQAMTVYNRLGIGGLDDETPMTSTVYEACLRAKAANAGIEIVSSPDPSENVLRDREGFHLGKRSKNGVSAVDR